MLRRAQADSAGLGDDDLSATAITPREIGSVLTVRLEPSLMEAVRAEATRQQVTVSDLVRASLRDRLASVGAAASVFVSFTQHPGRNVGSQIQQSSNSGRFSALRPAG
ncbi:MAG: ribbon-helix-helix protein, CopG family [Pseudonocardiaceae bacterium]